MARRKRRNHSSLFKAKVALEAVRGESTLAEIAEKYDLHANQIQRWKNDLVEGAAEIFGDNKKERKDKINRDKTLPKTRKCELLKISRPALYNARMRSVIKPEELELCRLIDELHLKYPWMGSRSLRDQVVRRTGKRVNRKRIRRLMGLMGIHAVYSKPRTSIAGKGHKIYPYLLRGLEIDRPDIVWAADITFVPMARGFLYLVAIMDWHSRKVLAWRLSNSMDVSFCIEALQESILRYGTPQIFNTDQGTQFTSEAFTSVLNAADIRISMDGKGRWIDNVFIERVWRSLKYEEVYLKAYESVAEARESIGIWMNFYNTERTHQSLERQTPDEVYFKDTLKEKAA